MVGVTHVSVVQEPHISVVGNFVVFAAEELGEVLCRLHDVTQPNESG